MIPALPAQPSASSGICGWIGVSTVCHAIGAGVSSVAGDAINWMANDFLHAEQQAFIWVTSLWVNIPSPQFATSDLSAPTGAAAFIWNDTRWYVAAFAMGGLLIAAGKLALERRAEPARTAVYGILTLAVVTSVTAGVVELSVEAGDQYSQWIINQAFGQQGMQGGIENLTSLGVQATVGSALVLILAIIAIVACLIQIALLLTRVAMLTLLMGMLPLAAAMSGTQTGREWFQKFLSWMFAYALYKPVAATIYAAAFVSMQSQSGVTQVAGMVMVLMAIVALPALMRFFSPVAAPATGAAAGLLSAGATVFFAKNVAKGAIGAMPEGARSKMASGASKALRLTSGAGWAAKGVNAVRNNAKSAAGNGGGAGQPNGTGPTGANGPPGGKQPGGTQPGGPGGAKK